MKLIDFIKKIKTSKNLKEFPKHHALAIGTLGCSLLLFSVISPSNETQASVQVQSQKVIPIALVSSEFETAEAPIESTSIELVWRTETVKSGDNLSLLFQRAGLSDKELYNLMSTNSSTKDLTRLYPGQEIKFDIEDKKLKRLKYQKNELTSVEFKRTDSGFEDTTHTIQPDILRAYREATITNSLFLAGTKVGLEEGLIMELAGIFGWDVDFALDIRPNDSFKVLYEEYFINGKKLKNGNILAAEFTNQGKTFKAVRFENNKGQANYYTPEGKSMRKAFLRTPVDFARISSHFNLKRKHPILNTIRAHKGTDYAAPRGTPIKAAGDGKVSFAGTKGGYGKTVIIQHGQSYKTLYAHLNKYGKSIRNGTRVKQGQIIGYVGTSGLATGPHLHYEFYLNGSVRNPLKVKLPKAKSIPKDQLAEFTLQTKPLVAQIESFDKKQQLASTEDQNESTTN